MATQSLNEHLGPRNSQYPMIPIQKAVNIILNEIESATSVCYARLNECGNRILAKDVLSPIDLPRVNTSIMDGYALNYGLNYDQNTQSVGSELGIFKVISISTAGNEETQKQKLEKGQVIYVTTGAAMPYSTDCVVKVEDTQIIDENTIKIVNAPLSTLQAVRTKGSDIKKGQLLLSKGSKLKSCELGILASCGIIMVPCYNKIRVTVLSTGDELKNPFTFNQCKDDDPSKNLIFDSNKIMLTELINESLHNLCIVKDGGIIGDNRQKLKLHILSLLKETDILIISGGVSMGSRDYVKPILAEIGDIKIGRICVKPGKPTTFATVMVADNDNDSNALRKKLVFGLPGNPVSCHVCFKMFIEPAIKKSIGVPTHFQCQHPPISVEIAQDIRMDPVRPNYNRCVVYWDKSKSKFIGFQTGSQRSSRLLSCKSANCLLRIPQKKGILSKGTTVKALVIGDLIPDMPPKISLNDEKESEQDTMRNLMSCDCGRVHDHNDAHHYNDNKRVLQQNVNIGILTVSDRASKKIYKDESGPALMDGLKELFGEECIDEIVNEIVADEKEQIEKCLNEWNGKYHLIVTTGGTGFGKRDITPECTKPLIYKECNGIVYKMMEYSLKKAPFACLSRYVAGITKKNTLIINMPGSVKAVNECLDAIKMILPHAMDQINK